MIRSPAPSRNLLVREAVRMKNKTAGLLMEVGAPYSKQRLHAKSYFYPLLDEGPTTGFANTLRPRRHHHFTLLPSRLGISASIP